MRLQAIPAMLSMLPSIFRSANLGDLDRIRKIVRASFPDVPQMSTEALAESIQESAQELLLIDVRPPEEYRISHLPGAANLQTAEEIIRAIDEKKPSTTILYCAVGYRSSNLAKNVIQRGIGNVCNLDGSIFKWANENRPLVNDTEKTVQVHAYSKKWAGMLKPGVGSGV